jgi:CheY-like chemotaxis protein
MIPGHASALFRSAAPDAEASAATSAVGSGGSSAEFVGVDATRTSGLLSGVRVLLVDDDPDARELFAMVLRNDGAQVATADSAEAALAAFALARPDVLLSDIGMPGQDGYSLMRRVRALAAEAGGRVPSLALTAFTGPDHRARAIEAGFTMHAGKPIDPERLVAVTAELAGRGH